MAARFKQGVTPALRRKQTKARGETACRYPAASTHIHSPTHSAISDAGESATGWDNQQTSVIFKESIYYIAVILTLRGQLWISLYYFIFLHFGRGLYQAFFFFFFDLGLSRWIVAFTRPTLPFHFKQNLHFKLLSLPCGHTPSIINEKSSVMKLFLSWLLFFILSFLIPTFPCVGVRHTARRSIFLTRTGES